MGKFLGEEWGVFQWCLILVLALGLDARRLIDERVMNGEELGMEQKKRRQGWCTMR
jgi:hypothetical protein